jgi:8-oxo-dGTP pyrophosphatase MutT (NUDIX family)
MFVWLTRFIERHPILHRMALLLWRWFPPRLAGFLKGLLARKWLVGAVAVMIDDEPSPPQILLAEHSYRPKGAWGLPGGSLESAPGDPTQPHEDSGSDVLESALRREVSEELGIEISVLGLLRIDAIPYIAEEPGPYRLDFYFRCAPRGGFRALRQNLESGRTGPCSPEIRQVRLVPLDELGRYDLFSSDARFLARYLHRHEHAPGPGRGSTAAAGKRQPARHAGRTRH